MTAPTSTRPAYVLQYFRSLGAWTVTPEICGTVVLSDAVGRSSLPAAICQVARLLRAENPATTVVRADRVTAHLTNLFTTTSKDAN